jgi:hypothetical protein
MTINSFSVSGGRVSAGIAASKDATTVPVGSEGRGRKIVRVPLPAGGVVEGGRLVSCLGRDNEPLSAVVLIEDHSGFRGGWHLRDPRTSGEWGVLLRRQDAHAVDADGRLIEGHINSGLAPGGSCPGCDRDVGPVPSDRPPTWRTVAEGYSAQGDAGRMGGGPVYLAVLRDGEAVEIVRSGRLYGAPATVKVANVGGKVVTSFPRQEAEAARAASAW